jgi:hypothetical protein
MPNRTVRIRPQVKTVSGNRKGWIKKVESVDPSKKDGYAFNGYFLNENAETDEEVGAVLLRVDPEGSQRRNYQTGHVLRVAGDGELIESTPSNLNWRNDFLTIRDSVVTELDWKNKAEQNEHDHPGELSTYTDEQIIEEAKKRNLILKKDK